jgi:hypothetical protein
MVPLMNPATKASASARGTKRIPAHMIVISPAAIRTNAAADYTGKSCRVALRCLGGDPLLCSAARPLNRRGGRRVDDESPRRRPVNVHTSVATGVSARARTGSPVPIGGEPFRQGREHGHSRFWPLLQYGV